MAVPLDTHEVVKRLTGAGFTAEQAEAVTGVVRDARADDAAAVATKGDLELAKADLELGLARLRADLEAGLARTDAALRVGLANVATDVERTKAETVRWVAGMLGLQTVTIVGAVLALMRLLPR